VLAPALRRSVALGTIAALAAVNASLGLMLATARTEAVALALVPVIAVALGALIASSRAILVFAAIAINLFAPLPLTDPIGFHGTQIFLSDVLVLLAVASWVAAWLINPEDVRPSPLHTRLLGWPLLLFGALLLIAILHGHERYGGSLISVPVRLFLYAGIAAALTDLKPRDAYRWLVVLFYAGTLWQVVVALYHYATGTTFGALDAELSTGGERVLAGSTAMFMAGALILALLNLDLERDARRSILHLVMALLATFALVSTLQRTTFALIPLLVPLSLIAFRHIGLRLGAFLPLFAPVLVLVALLVPRADPTFFPTLTDRVTANPGTDTSTQWREKAIGAVWTQVREAPVTGVGFGRTTSFELDDQRTFITQDPHNQFIYLWAGGGLLLLLSFALLLIMYLAESWYRYKNGTIVERRFLFWTVSLWFVFLVNSATGIVLTDPPLLLTFWVLMLFPMIVPRRDRISATESPAWKA
jgi:O-antigen ligase